MEKGTALVIAVLLCIASISSAQDMAGAVQAKAFYYKKPYSPSYCFGEERLGDGVASVSDDLWENGKACGRIYRVWCKSALSDDVEQACLGHPYTILGDYVKVVDNCKKCENGTILLSEESFESIAHKEAGNILVLYKIP